MDYEALALFALTETLLSLTPGPAVLFIIGLSMRKGFADGFGGILGVLTANAFYFALSALGVGALILASATLFALVKWAGAAYLVYLGFQMLIPLVKRLREDRSSDAQVIDIKRAAQDFSPRREAWTKSFVRGFTLQASNPKNIVFFVAILPLFVTPEGNVALQLTTLGVVSVLLEGPILMVYAFASAKSASIMKERLVDWIEGIGGGLLIAMGGVLSFYRRSE